MATPQSQIYQSQLTPDAAITPADAQGQRVISGIGEGGGALAQGINTSADLGLAKLDDDSRAFAVQASSAADLGANQMLENAKNTAADGAVGFKASLLGDWQKFQDDALEKAPNNETKRLLQDHLASVTENLTAQADKFETTSRQAWRADQIDKSVDADSKFIAMQPKENLEDSVSNALGKVATYYQNEPMTPTDRLTAINTAREKITNAAAMRAIQLDPTSFLAQNITARNTARINNDPNMPLGLRNNNPGNLTDNGDAWQGKTGTDSKGYVQFDSPESGLRAMGKDLVNQQDIHGLNTVQDILTKYAPPSSNNTAAYISNVSNDLGVQPTDKIDMHDPATLQAFMRAGIKQENGTQPYSDNQIAAGAGAAINNTDVTPQNSGNPADGTRTLTGSTNFNLGTWEQQRKWITYAESEQHRVNTEVKAKSAQAEQLLNTTKERLSAGLELPPQEMAQINAVVQATPDPKIVKRWADLQDTQQLASSMRQLSPADLSNMITTQLEPAVHRDGATEREMMQLDIATKMQKTMQEKVTTDPIGWAASTGTDVQPLDFRDPASVSNRIAVASSVAQKYGTEPRLMTASEAKQLSTQMSNLPVQNQMTYLKGLRQNIPDDSMYQATMQQLRPDSPVTAMAGSYLGLDGSLKTSHLFKADTVMQPSQVAENLLLGEQLLNPPAGAKKEDGSGKRFPMPPDTGSSSLRADFDQYIGDSFRGMPQAADQAYQATRAYYAAAASKKGQYDGVLNTDIANQSVNAVVGNIVAKGGHSVVAPWGMDESSFLDAAQIQAEKQIKDQGIGRVSWGDLSLENTGEQNKYRATVGAGYLLDNTGRPLVIDVSKDNFTPLRQQLKKSYPASSADMTGEQWAAKRQSDRLDKIYGVMK